jgi:hypothetical protein
MKNLLSTAALLLAVHGIWAQTNCSELYDYFKKGLKLEYTSYDAKGKVESVNNQEVLDVTTNADTVIALIQANITDKKGEQAFSGTFPIKCFEGVLYFDMQSMIPPQQGTGAEGSEMALEIKSTDMIFPADMQVGMSLPDCDMEMKMSMGSIAIMNTRYHIKNRKVEGRETITTTAGAFDCLKISYDIEYNLLGKRTDHVEYWYAKSKGLMIRTISTDSKGKERSRTELTKL